MIKRQIIKARYLLAYITTIVIVFIITYGYNISLQENLESSFMQTLSEVVEQQRFNMYQELTSDKKHIKNISIMISEIEPKDSDEAVKVLKRAITNTHFDNLVFVDRNGVGTTENEIVIDASDREYFIRSLSGETVISNPVKSKIRDAYIVPISSPVYKKGTDEIIGVVMGVYTVDQLKELILSSFGGDGFVYITDGNGELITTTISEKNLYKYSNNFIKSIDSGKLFSSKTNKSIYNDMLSGVSDSMIFKIDSEKKYCHYMPIGINDWYIFAVVDEDVVAASANLIRSEAILLGMWVIIGVILVGFVTLMQQLRHSKEINNLAFYDRITGFPNSEFFKSQINDIMIKYPNKNFCCVIFDVHNFKVINNTKGVKVGDMVLKTISYAIKDFTSTLRDDQVAVCRIHSDTFAVFMEDKGSVEVENRRAEFEKLFQQRLDFLKGYKLDFYQGKYRVRTEDNADTIYERTILAHTKAKENFPNLMNDYDELYNSILINEFEIRNSVEEAMENQEFEVYLQEKFEINTGRLYSAEALVRWNNKGEFLSPEIFIPVLEKTGLIVKLDMYVFESCCKIIALWKADGRSIPISVNFSRHHIRDINFAANLKNITSKYHISPNNFIIEITETVAIENYERMIQVITELHSYGFNVSMDDFGSGYSSLGLLEGIKVDEIKLDRSLIQNIGINERSYSIVKNIIAMARDLNILVVAEGIEDTNQLYALKAMGCDYGQGYILGKPKQANEILMTDDNSLTV